MGRQIQSGMVGVVVLIAAACGTGQHFRLKATRSCLDAHGYTTSTENNWLFKPTEGTLDVLFGRRYVSLNFGKDDREARRIRDAALQVDSTWPIGARGNVAYVWSTGERSRVSAVLACLRR